MERHFVGLWGGVELDTHGRLKEWIEALSFAEDAPGAAGAGKSMPQAARGREEGNPTLAPGTADLARLIGKRSCRTSGGRRPETFEQIRGAKWWLAVAEVTP